MLQLVEREQRLNAGLLRAGKFKEALGTLMEWMSKMDSMLAEQKLTSTDYKFLKSQLQMQQVSSCFQDRNFGLSFETINSALYLWLFSRLGQSQPWS